MRKSKALLISMIVGILYTLYLVSYFFNGMASSQSSSEAIGSTLATALVTPHMILMILAVIFNTLAYLQNRKGYALVSGILYSVAAGLFLLYAPFVILEIIFSFIGYSKLKKREKEGFI